MLSTNTKAPVVTKATMGADLLQALQIITKFRVNTVSENLGVFAIDNIPLTIEEPCWDLVLGGILDDGDNSLELFRGKLTSTTLCHLVPYQS